jgi:hypothetical protein
MMNDCAMDSGSASNEEVVDWLSIVKEFFEGDLRLVGPESLPLVISVVCFLVNEPPRFFLVGNLAPDRLIG